MFFGKEICWRFLILSTYTSLVHFKAQVECKNEANLFWRFKSFQQGSHVWWKYFVVQMQQHPEGVSVDIFFTAKYADRKKNWKCLNSLEQE